MQSEAENRFGYETIAVHVDLTTPAAARIGVAAELATRLGSSLIGVAGELPLTGYSDESALGAPRRLVADETRRVAGDLARAEALFKSSLGSAASKAGSAYEWRGYAQDPIQVLREQMLRCDLLVIGRQGVDDEADWRLGVAPQDVVLEIGRPLLLVPPAASFKGDCVVVAWKDTREARRALWDALPLLKRADMVLLGGVQERGQLAAGAVMEMMRSNETSDQTVGQIAGRATLLFFSRR